MQYSNTVQNDERTDGRYQVVVTLAKVSQEVAQRFLGDINDMVLNVNATLAVTSPESQTTFDTQISTDYYAPYQKTVKVTLGNLGLAAATVAQARISGFVALIEVGLKAREQAEQAAAEAELASQFVGVRVYGVYDKALNNKVNAIKALRSVTQMGLKEAKDTTEAVMGGEEKDIKVVKAEFYNSGQSFADFNLYFQWEYTE